MSFHTLVEIPGVLEVVERDPEDNAILECAQAGQARFVITGAGMVDEVAERARQGQGFGGDGAGGLDGAAVFVPQGVEDGGGLVSIVRPLSGYNPTLATARWPECWRTRNDVLAW